MSRLRDLPLFSDANLVSYWTYDGNSNDSKGSNNGTDHNMSYSSLNVAYGQGAVFNGTTSYIDIVRSATLEATNFSIVGWIYNTQAVQTSGGAGVEIEDILTKEGANTGYALYLSSTNFDGLVNNGLVGFTGNGTSLNFAKSTVAIPVNKLTHVAFTHSDTNSRNRCYVNGVLQQEVVCSAISQATTQDLIVGAFTDGGASRHFYGNEDDFAYFSRELTQAEIQTLSTMGNLLMGGEI